jgi:hypothetical protein
LSVPLRNSLISFPVTESHIRTSVPRDDVVANRRPDGGNEIVLRADVCAAIIDAVCVVGDLCDFCAGNENGLPTGPGSGQGGR